MVRDNDTHASVHLTGSMYAFVCFAVVILISLSSNG